MAAETSITVKDLLDVVWRRPRLILAVSAMLTIASSAVLVSLPDVYEAKSVVSLDEGLLPDSFKKAGVVVPKLADVIGGLRQEVLSRQSIREIITELELYEDGGKSSSDGGVIDGLIQRFTYVDPIERAREDITVNIVKRHAQVFIEITVKARAPELAARTANRIADLFSAKNHEFRVQLAHDVQQFIGGELDDARKKREEVESRLSDFRESNRESLPENEPALHARIAQIWSRTETQKRELEEIEVERAAIDVQITGLIESLKKAAEDDGVGLAPELEALRAEEADLAKRGYTENHPDRKKLRNEIDRVEAELAARLADGPPAGAGGDALPAVDGAGLAGLDKEKVIKALDARGADEETLDKVRGLLARITVLSTRSEMLLRQQQRDLRELERLEVVRAALASSRTELEKLGEEGDRRRTDFERLLADQGTIDKFLAAEEAKRGDQLRTVDSAEAPLVPVAPKRLRLGLLALLASCGAGFGLAYLLEVKKKTEVYRDRSEIENDLGVKVLAALPIVSDPAASTPDADTNLPWLKGKSALERFHLEEQFNRLRHTIIKEFAGRRGGSILVTSAIKGEGKSTVATGLALAFARSLDHTVLLIDADLRNPSVVELFDLPPGPGIEEHIRDGVPLDDIVRPTPIPKLSVVCSGKRSAQAADLTESSQMRQLALEVQQKHEDAFVIYDAPPVMPTPDPLSLSVLVDAIVVVIGGEATPRPAVRQTIEALPSEKLLGVIFNRAVARGTSYYYYYDGAAPASPTNGAGATNGAGGNGATAAPAETPPGFKAAQSAGVDLPGDRASPTGTGVEDARA